MAIFSENFKSTVPWLTAAAGATVVATNPYLFGLAATVAPLAGALVVGVAEKLATSTAADRVRKLLAEKFGDPAALIKNHDKARAVARTMELFLRVYADEKPACADPINKMAAAAPDYWKDRVEAAAAEFAADHGSVTDESHPLYPAHLLETMRAVFDGSAMEENAPLGRREWLRILSGLAERAGVIPDEVPADVKGELADRLAAGFLPALLTVVCDPKLEQQAAFNKLQMEALHDITRRIEVFERAILPQVRATVPAILADLERTIPDIVGRLRRIETGQRAIQTGHEEIKQTIRPLAAHAHWVRRALIGLLLVGAGVASLQFVTHRRQKVEMEEAEKRAKEAAERDLAMQKQIQDLASLVRNNPNNPAKAGDAQPLPSGEGDPLAEAVARALKAGEAGDAEAAKAIAALREVGDSEKLQTFLKERMQAADDEKISLAREFAAVSYTRGDISEAWGALEEILRLKPGDWSALNEMGRIHMLRGELDDAGQIYGRLLTAAETAGENEGIAVASGNLGAIYRTLGELDRAEQMHNKSLVIAKKLGNQEGMANQYGNLGLIYLTRGELDRAQEALTKALMIDEKLGRQEGMAVEYGNLGLIHLTRRELDLAEEMHKKSLAIHEMLGQQEGISVQCGNLGLIYMTRGELDWAEAMLKKALAIDEKIGRQEGMANAYGNLAIIYWNDGKLDRAEEMLKKALAIDEKLGRQEGMANAYSNLGNIYWKSGELGRAEEMHQKSLTINEKLGRQDGMATDLGNLGLIYRGRRELDRAEEMHKKSLTIHEKLGQMEGVAHQYANLGVIREQQKRFDEAREFWVKARALYGKIGMPHMVKEKDEWLAGLPK